MGPQELEEPEPGSGHAQNGLGLVVDGGELLRADGAGGRGLEHSFPGTGRAGWLPPETKEVGNAK